MIRWIAICLSLAVVFILPACQASEASPAPRPTRTAGPPSRIIEPEGLIERVHDPVIAKEDGSYYVFYTGSRIPILCSPDMVTWELCARVFKMNPLWTRDINKDLVDIWAPDISYFNGKWHLYYAVSTFGSQGSAIGLATNATLNPQAPEYSWEDQGIVLRSQVGDRWNAIDPNLVMDESGEPWLSWGSFWEGIWMRKIDPETGMFSANDTEYHHLASRRGSQDNTDAIEAPFIVNHDGWWYLFVSFDQCCKGADSTYNLRVGRSESLTGPYVDRAGVPLLEGGGTPVLSEYDRWRGQGHNGILIEDGVYWLVYHAYDAIQNGVSKLRIESIAWDEEGWPSVVSQSGRD